MAFGRKRKAPAKKGTKLLRSGFEKKTQNFLKQENFRFEYETERIPYTVPEATKNYIPDFIVYTPSKKKVYIECKGRFLPADRRKILLVLKDNPGMNLKVLFMRDNYLRKGSKTTYSMWCEKNGVEYAVNTRGIPPEEWLQ